MRRTKHRRRFHTARIIRKRQRRYRRIISPEDRPTWARELQAGRVDRGDYFGCTRPRCLVCHWDKLVEPRRAREKRSWTAWTDEY
jgi:hypothetical protein